MLYLEKTFDLFESLFYCGKYKSLKLFQNKEARAKTELIAKDINLSMNGCAKYLYPVSAEKSGAVIFFFDRAVAFAAEIF